MKRLLLVPAVVCPVAVAAWWSGMVYPIVTQLWSVLAPRPHLACDEDDVIA